MYVNTCCGNKNKKDKKLKKKKNPGLKFNPRLALTGGRTTGPRRHICLSRISDFVIYM